MKLLLFVLLSTVYSSPYFDCPNGLTPREAQKCTEKLSTYSDKLERVEEKDALKSKTIKLMKDSCNTFRNCYSPEKLCSLYDPTVGNQVQSACEFYELVTRETNRQCGQKLEKASDNSIPCLNAVADMIVDTEASAAQKCSVFRSNSQCASQELRSICSAASASDFERFFSTQAQLNGC